MMPEGEAVGLDHSETVLEEGRKEAGKQGVTNVTFVKGDAYDCHSRMATSTLCTRIRQWFTSASMSALSESYCV